MLEKTYKMQIGPPPPIVEDYITSCNQAWLQLLASSPEEKAVQAFLEQNPMLLPGAWTPATKSGHYPIHCAAISQPRLLGLKSKIPDFMWIAKHSSTWYPTLIEIERPSKKIFTAKGIPCADFSQARNQLAEWRMWFNRPGNVQMFLESYGIPDHVRLGRKMQLHMILIYGRRSEFENSSELSEKRAALFSGDDEELMSFDRLYPDRELRDAITIRAVSNGRYEAVAIPPVFRLGPNQADRLNVIEGVSSALKDTPLISEERRAFLLSRIPYWMHWNENRSTRKNGKFSIINGSDNE